MKRTRNVMVKFISSAGHQQIAPATNDPKPEIRAGDRLWLVREDRYDLIGQVLRPPCASDNRVTLIKITA
jgi:hypothetical protein